MIDADVTFWVNSELRDHVRVLTGICIGYGEGVVHVLCLVFRHMEVFVINEDDVIGWEPYKGSL